VRRPHMTLEAFLRQPVPKEATKQDVERALDLLGFALRSHHGSHYRWRHPDGTQFDYKLISGRKVSIETVKDMAAEIRRQGRGE